MNAYNFIRKAYGTGNLRSLNLYIKFFHGPKIYQVIGLSTSLRLLDENLEECFLSSENTAKVKRASVTRLAKPKTILHIGVG